MQGQCSRSSSIHRGHQEIGMLGGVKVMLRRAISKKSPFGDKGWW
jgi:hypothetical protein